MARFRKRPVVIDADQWLPELTRQENLPPCCTVVSDAGELCVEIATLEGIVLARPGDWIIRGVKGEYYPCKPDIFAATYDPEP